MVITLASMIVASNSYRIYGDRKIKVLGCTLWIILTLVNRGKTILSEEHLLLNKLVSSQSPPSFYTWICGSLPFWEGFFWTKGGLFTQDNLSFSRVSTCNSLLGISCGPICERVSDNILGKVSLINTFMYYLF